MVGKTRASSESHGNEFVDWCIPVEIQVKD